MGFSVIWLLHFVIAAVIYIALFRIIIFPQLTKPPVVYGFNQRRSYRDVSGLRMKWIRFVLRNEPDHEFKYIPKSLSNTDCVFFDTSLLISGTETDALLRMPEEAISLKDFRSKPAAALFSAAACMSLSFLDGENQAKLQNILEKMGIRQEQFAKTCTMIQKSQDGNLDSCRVLSGGKEFYIYISTDTTVIRLSSFLSGKEKKVMTNEMRNSLCLLSNSPRNDSVIYHYAMADIENNVPGLLTYLGSIELFSKPVYDSAVTDAISFLTDNGYTVGYVDNENVYLQSDKYNLERDVSLLKKSIAIMDKMPDYSPFCCTLAVSRNKSKDRQGYSADTYTNAVFSLINHDRQGENITVLMHCIAFISMVVCSFFGNWYMSMIYPVLMMCLSVIGFNKKSFSEKSSIIDTGKIIISSVVITVTSFVMLKLCSSIFNATVSVSLLGWLTGFYPAMIYVCSITTACKKSVFTLTSALCLVLLIIAALAIITTDVLPCFGVSAAVGLISAAAFVLTCRRLLRK